MNDGIQHFLLMFDRPSGHLIGIEEFGTDEDRALDAYDSAEVLYRDRREVEVVLIGSDSIETVRKTHANYFDGIGTVSRHLAGI